MTSDVNDGSSDNCGIQTMSLNQTSFDCNDLGTQTVTLTVTDVNGNQDTCQATVTVTDNIAPTVTCKSATIQLDGSGNATLLPTQVHDVTTDNCAIELMSVTPNTFTCSNIGANTVTLTVTDYGGNTDDCVATVTVEDDGAPVAKCKAHTVNLDANGAGSLTAADIDDNSTDGCGIASLVASPNSFDCSNIGTNMVTLTVTDTQGQSSSCTSTVTVEDNVAPTAKCKNMTTTCGGNQVTISASDIDDGSTDNCGGVTLSLSQTIIPCSSSPVTVTLTATDASGNTDNCTATVTIQSGGGLTVSVGDVTKLEGNGWGFTLFKFELVRSGGTGAVTVHYATADGTAKTYLDYFPKSGVMSWSNGGSDVKEVTVYVKKDQVVEPDEVFYLNLSSPSSGASISDGQGDGTILNDDGQTAQGNAPSLTDVQSGLQPERMLLYPNPVRERVHIEVPERWLESGSVRAALLDNTGRTLRTFEWSNAQNDVDVHVLENGIYHLVIYKADGTIVSERFVKSN
ncbi:MAG: T9SS C-terminal target domain-containing protein [Bacteroidetes bacterium]|nr:MAG: T9SS C-terminal target domain-containing protein [Bacteroidota bacterium]